MFHLTSFLNSFLFQELSSLGWAQEKGPPFVPVPPLKDPKGSRKEGQGSAYLHHHCPSLILFSEGQSKPFQGNQLEENHLSGLCLLDCKRASEGLLKARRSTFRAQRSL